MTPTPPTPGEQFATLKLSTITPSLSNPRKHFDATALTELATSITALGVHQPVLVRPLPGSRVADTDRGVQYELVCGERRYRASLQAGVPTIPAMVRALTDDQVREIQIVENLQRQDLTELEEAEGYEQLMQHSGYTADQVGDKIGKSRSYVYARLKLLDLCLDAKQAMREGRIDSSRGLLISRIPDAALQAKALAFATTERGYPAELPSVRALQIWLRDNVMLKLDHAIFKITDSRLVESAGNCTECPKRTGANPDLFAEVLSADICTDPACFHAKEEAHRAQLRKRAEAKGLRVVEGKEAMELLEGKQWLNLPYEYQELSTKRPDLGQEGDNVKTLGELLGKDAPDAILFIHPKTQVMTELVPTDKAQMALLAKGITTALDEEDDDKPGQRNTPQAALERLQEQATGDTNRAVHRATFDAARSAIRAAAANQALRLLTSGNLLRAILLTKLGYFSEDDIATALGYEFQDGEDENDALAMHIRATSSENLCKALVILEMGEDIHYSSNSTPLILNAVVQAMEIDTKAIAKEATATIKASYADRIKAAKALLKPDLPQSPLAQPENASGKGPEQKAKPNAKPAPLRKPKLSEQEAISGIAAAMQGVDRAAAAPDGAVALPEAQQAQLGVGFVIGQRVRVTTDNDKLGMYARKWSGKEGTVTKTNADNDSDMYDVTFKGRSGGIAMFRTDQIEVVAA